MPSPKVWVSGDPTPSNIAYAPPTSIQQAPNSDARLRTRLDEPGVRMALGRSSRRDSSTIDQWEPARLMRPLTTRRQDLGRLVALLGRDVESGSPPHRLGRRTRRPARPARARGATTTSARRPPQRQVKDHDVGLDRRRDRSGRRGLAASRVGDAPRMRVIVRQPSHVMVERVEAGGREDAGLPHRAAEHAPVRACARAISAARPGEQRAARRAEPLRQRDRDEVERRREHGGRRARRDRGVPDPRAVEKRRDIALRARRAQMRSTSCWSNTTPPPRLCVFSISTSVVARHDDVAARLAARRRSRRR